MIFVNGGEVSEEFCEMAMYINDCYTARLSHGDRSIIPSQIIIKYLRF